MDIEKVIQDNMGLVYKQLHRFNVINDADAYSYAVEALWTAVTTYDTSKNTKFSTYASVCIYNAIGSYLRKLKTQQKVIILPYDHSDNSIDDLDYASYHSAMTVQDTPLDYCERKELTEVLNSLYNKILSECTTDIAKQVVTEWYLARGAVQQVELAKKLGTSQPHVSRIISAAKYKFKKGLEDYLC